MTRRSRCALVFAACAAPRAVVLLRTPEPPPNYYWDIASTLIASGSYGFSSGVTTAIEPLYPLFLAAARLLTGDRFALAMLLQVLVASAGGPLLFLLARRVTGSFRAALIAAALYAFYPYYVRQSIAPLELTLSVVLLVATALAYFSLAQSPPLNQFENIKHAVVLGGCLGLLLLLRFSFAAVGVSAFALLLVERRFRAAATAAIVAGVLVAPWLLRTRAIDGSVLPTRGGVNLFVASCEYAEQVLPWYDADLMFGYAIRSVDAHRLTANVPPRRAQRVLDDALMRRAVECIRADPLRAVRLKLRNLLYVFSPLLLPVHARMEQAAAHVDDDGQLRFVNIYPRPRFHVVSHALAHMAVLAGAVLGLFVRHRHLREDAFLLAIVASIAVVYAIFFPTTRLTSPMMVVLMIYAGVGFSGFRVQGSGVHGSKGSQVQGSATQADGPG